MNEPVFKYHRDEEYRKNEDLFRNIFLKRVDLIYRYTPHFSRSNRDLRGKVLEIGCSIGVFLEIFKGHGWKTWGVEPSESAETAGKKGHKIIRGFFENVSLRNGFFDLVILNHTLEHMDNPAEILKKVHKILKKGGMVYVDVPNFGSLSSKILGKHWPYLVPEEHKHQFTKKALVQILEKSGFKVIHWESRSGIFEFANPLKLNKKRLLKELFLLPYSLLATALNMGDSMSIISKKHKQT